MRQTDGSELLGTNNPRSSEIGIIHVAPNDDRQSVLAAILTQDKLGTKQTVLVLPEENKAFQRPVDFEGLKNMRRGLKSEIIFIAPSGPGPAEFARQRRFPVYSSLEAYAQSLKDENVTPSKSKGGWLFGRKQKPADTRATPSPSSTDQERTIPLPDTSKNWAQPEQLSPQTSPQFAEEQHATNHTDEIALGGAGLAAGLGLAAASAHEHQTTPPGIEDWDTLPPPATTSQQPVNTSISEMSPQPPTQTPTNTGNNAEPGIIAFPTPRPRNSDKLPVPPIAAMPSQAPAVPLTNIPARQSNRGKRAAVVAAGGTGATMMGSTVVGAPPPRTGTAPGRGRAPRRRRNLLLALLALLLATVLCVAGIAFAAPSNMNPLNMVQLGGPPTATVTITPQSSDQTTIYGLTAITGKPDPTKRQVQSTLLSTTSTGQKTVPATGTGQTPGAKASGTLQFINLSTSTITIGSTTLIGSDGVQVTFNGPVVVSATTPATVTGYAVNAGSKGNISALDINGTCCVAGNQIFVKNPSAFSGGQDPKTFSVVQQSDIDGAVNALAPQQQQSAQKDLQSKITATERQVDSTTCTNTHSSDHAAGDQASNVTVTLTETCTGVVYNVQGAQTLAANLLKDETAKNPKLTNYVLNGDVVTKVTQASVIDTKGTVSLLVKAEGIWVYQFTDAAKAALAKLIANKSKNAALQLLANQAGIAKVDSIDISGGGNTLPSDPKQITFVVIGVPGLQASPTPPTATLTPQTGQG